MEKSDLGETTPASVVSQRMRENMLIISGIVEVREGDRNYIKTVKGIYAEAKIFTDDVEAYAEAQVRMICDNEVAEFQKLDRVIRENIPSGFAIRKEPHHMAEEFSYDGLHYIRHINRQKAERGLGTLGGGNHFIELDRGTDGSLYLMVHTGRRHLGEEVAEYYTRLASDSLKERYKEQDRETSQGVLPPYYPSYLEGSKAQGYMEDVQIIQRYAE